MSISIAVHLRHRACNQHPPRAIVPGVYAGAMWAVSAVFLGLWIGFYAIQRKPGGLVHAFLVVAICVALVNWVAHYRFRGE